MLRRELTAVNIIKGAVELIRTVEPRVYGGSQSCVELYGRKLPPVNEVISHWTKVAKPNSRRPEEFRVVMLYCF